MESPPTPQGSAEPPWVGLGDEELLDWRISDLRVRIEGSELEGRVAQLHKELESRALGLRPLCYLGDEWFSPEGVAAIAIPFYLAHPRLKQLEMRQMLEVEGGTAKWCLMLLRHECGHAFDHAYKFSSRRKWRDIFGNPADEYNPETYQPRPYSKRFVRHLPNWYAQSHPDEDFAETFAVWLQLPADEWRERYKEWGALEKLEYMDELMREAAQTPVAAPKKRLISDAGKLRRTLRKYYAAKKKLFAEDFPDFFDSDLRAILGDGQPSDGTGAAADLLRRHRKALVETIVRWTHQRKYTVNTLVNQFIDRCEWLELRAPTEHPRLFLDLGSYLAALVTNHMHTGHFKRSV
jgi:hypothetical protein